MIWNIGMHHDSHVRCPACGHEEAVAGPDWGHLYEKGEHAVNCPSCGEDFEVNTRVEYTFVSPPRRRKAAEED